MRFQRTPVPPNSDFNTFCKLRSISAHGVLDMFGIQRRFILFLVDVLLTSEDQPWHVFKVLTHLSLETGFWPCTVSEKETRGRAAGPRMGS